jgi:hypothetical protein
MLEQLETEIEPTDDGAINPLKDVPFHSERRSRKRRSVLEAMRGGGHGTR